MPKKSLVLNGFSGGLNLDSDASDLTSSGRDKDELSSSTNVLNDYKGKTNSLIPTTEAGSGISANGSNDTSADEVLIYDSVYYQQEGLYKHGNNVVYSGSTEITKPTAGALGQAGEHSGVINLSATASTQDDIIVFMGTAAAMYSGTAAAAATSNEGAIFGMSSGNPKYEDWDVPSGTDDFPNDQGDLASSTPGNGVITDVRWWVDTNAKDWENDWADMTYLGDEGAQNADGVAKAHTIDAMTADTWSADNQWTDDNLNSTDYASAGNYLDIKSIRFRTDSGSGDYEAVKVVFRTGVADESAAPSTFASMPAISGKNVTIEMAFNMSVGNWGKFDYLVIALDSKNASNIDCQWGKEGGDVNARIYKLTRTELEDYGFGPGSTDKIRLTLPEDSFASQGADFNANTVSTIDVGILWNDHPGSGIRYFQLYELSFTQTELSSWSNNDYIFWQTKLSDDAEKSERIESLPVKYTGGIFNTDNVTGNGVIFRVTRPTEASIHNGRIYWQLSDADENGIGERFLLCNVDKDGNGAAPAAVENTGVKPAGQEQWLAWEQGPSNVYAVTFTMANRPESSTYQLESGYPDDTEHINANWETAAVVGRQVYVGSVRQPYEVLYLSGTSTHASGYGNVIFGSSTVELGTSTIFEDNFVDRVTDLYINISSEVGDWHLNNGHWKIIDISAGAQATITVSGTFTTTGTNSSTYGYIQFGQYEEHNGSKILKSAVGKYYGFPNSSYIDLEFGGDQINVLKGVGDRLFVFSSDKLTIINVAQDFEVLEGQFENMGVLYHKQVCKINEGIAWVNPAVVHYFDGSKVQTLSDEKLMSVAWDDTSIIGYFPPRKMLLVWLNAAIVYCYSFKSNSWAGDVKDGGLIDEPPETNIVSGLDGNTYYIGTSNSFKRTIEIAGATGIDSTMLFQTGKIDMGDLSREKKFKKIYLTSTGGAGNEILDWDLGSGSYTSNSANITAGTTNEYVISGVGKYIRLKVGCAGSTTLGSFEINDITIIYREKTVK